ncbi:MAG: 5-(carboxyamino)imidazole ribonucleotide mutase [Deltaproteobacteria bacterium]|nr:5-(carboxyamino)imidazole ribonucleotide mutase [Deltaproteobacteria bacterium]
MHSVAVIMGSKSDEALVRPCVDILNKLGIKALFTISSAHRTPERTEKLVAGLEKEGCKIFICAAGLAAHLAGTVAARTVRPVIGIPVASGSLGGMDALLSTVMMPAGFPVATLALDKTGARNAAWLAAQILALNDRELEDKIRAARKEMAREVEQNANELQPGT